MQLKVRFGDFTTVTRSRTLAEPTDLAADLRRVAGELLHALDVAPGVRLLGVSGQQLLRRAPATVRPGHPLPGDRGFGTLGTLEPDALRPDALGPGVRAGGRGAPGRTLERSVDKGAGPTFVSVTYGAGGSTRDRTIEHHRADRPGRPR